MNKETVNKKTVNKETVNKENVNRLLVVHNKNGPNVNRRGEDRVTNSNSNEELNNENKTKKEYKGYKEYKNYKWYEPKDYISINNHVCIETNCSNKNINKNENVKNTYRNNESFVKNKKCVQMMFYKNRKENGVKVGNIRILFGSEKKKKKELKKKIAEHILLKKKRKKRKEFEEKRKYKEFLNARIEEEKEKGVFYILPKHLRIKKKSKLKKEVLLEKEIKNEIYTKLMERKKLKELYKDLFYLIKNRKKWNLQLLKNSFHKRFYKTNNRNNVYSCYFLNLNLMNYWKKRTNNRKRNVKNEQCISGEIIENKQNNEEQDHINKKTKIVPGDQHMLLNHNYTYTIKKVEENEKHRYKWDSSRGSITGKEETFCEDAKKKELRKGIKKNREIIDYIKKTQIEKRTYINNYVDQEITEELNNMVKEFLIKVKKSHEKYLQKNKKRYHLGLKECYKHICVNEPKLVIIAPNIEPLQNNAFVDIIEQIKTKCQEKNIPVVYALSRNALGKCLNTLRQSIVCIVHIDSFEKECEEIIKLSKILKKG